MHFNKECIECCDGNVKQILLCNAKDCPLYATRYEKKPSI